MDKKELEKFESLKLLTETDGGRYLIEISKQVCVDIVGQIANTYSDKNEVELKTLCAKLNVNLANYQLLTGIEKQIEAIKEVLKQEE